MISLNVSSVVCFFLLLIRDWCPVGVEGALLRAVTAAATDKRLYLQSQQKPQNTSEKNKLVELYQYPGYDEHEPTPLPNGTELAEVIEKVVCAQRKSASGKVLCILTKSSKCVNASLIIHSFLSWFRYQNALIKVFPSLLSQTLYTCFCSSFPRSWFNTHEFKSQLCNVLSEWMAGTLPVPGSYSNWDYSHLEPERFRREDLLSTKGKQRKGKSTDEIAFPTCSSAEKWKEAAEREERARRGCMELLAAQDRVCQMQQETARLSLFSFVSSPFQSHPACQGPDFTWHLFNINGHSPLIQHFLQSYNVEPQSGQDILIHRREICKPIPYPYDQLRNIRDGKILLRHILSIPQELGLQDLFGKEMRHTKCLNFKALLIK
uniref:Family with sequence similarity 227 member A n=1 Tax=Gopherus evgoodei TaxID=1825980 RepID=A0A8C4VJ12_9SAUR